MNKAKAEDGKEITVTATPNENWTFAGWGGDYSGTENPATIIMDNDKELIALFKKIEHAVTINTEGGGSVIEEVIQQKTTDYPHSTLLKLTAEPDYGWVFVEWSGDVSGSNPAVEIEVESPLEITATFERLDFPLTIHTEGEGNIKQEVIQAKTTDYPFETQVQLTAEPAPGWEFTEWSGDASGADGVIVIDMDAEKEITATFKRIEFQVTVNVEGGGSVEQEIVQAKTTEYPFETQVRLTAVPETGWEFDGWSGDANGTDTVVVIDIDESKEITASFKRVDYQVTIDIEGEGGVDQEIIQGKSTEFPFGTQLQLTAKPDSDWLFYKWSGDADSADEVILIEVDNTKKITATFIQLPTLVTLPVTDLLSTSAMSGGKLSNPSRIEIEERGICWSTDPGTDPHTNTDIECKISNSKSRTFPLSITDLEPKTDYYVRAYAIYNLDSSELILGEERTFTTPGPEVLATVSTKNASSITTNSAVSGGDISDSGGAEIADRGICWGTSKNPDHEKSDCISDGEGIGSFSITLNNLSPDTRYYVRAYAVNFIGTAYGDQIEFTTGQSVTQPTVTTTSVSSITTSSASAGGSVTDDGGSPITQRGVCWSTSQNPTTNHSCTNNGTGTGSFSSSISGLSQSTTYYVRAYAINSGGTSYGNQVNFTTETGSSTPPPDPGEGTPPPPPANPVPANLEVLVIFLDSGFTFTTPVDVKLNNTWYRFKGRSINDPNWNSFLGDARGQIINLNETVTRVELDPNQVKFAGLNNHGFGFTSIKIMAKHPSSNLRALNADPESINYWAYSYQGMGILVLRSGYNATLSPDPYFYMQNIPNSWSSSGKLVILIGGVGKHHPSFPADWHP